MRRILLAAFTAWMLIAGWTWAQGYGPGGGFGSSGVTDHGSLQGLSDNDHTQYGLLAGTNTWTGTNTFSGNVVVSDDSTNFFGTSKNYWITYDNSQWEFWGTDVDGGGTDGLIWSVDDGTDDVDVAGDIVCTTRGNKIDVSGDGGEYIYSSGDNKIRIACNSGNTLHEFTHQELRSSINGGYYLKTGTGSSTVPVIGCKNAETDGFWMSGNIIYAIANSVNQGQWGVNGLTVIKRIVHGTTDSFTTAGPTDNVDVSDINTLFVDASGATVTIGGFTGGVDGQILHVVRTESANDVVLEHAEGGGNQDIYLSTEGDETLSTYGGWTLMCNGTHWYEVDSP